MLLVIVLRVTVVLVIAVVAPGPLCCGCSFACAGAVAFRRRRLLLLGSCARRRSGLGLGRRLLEIPLPLPLVVVAGIGARFCRLRPRCSRGDVSAVRAVGVTCGLRRLLEGVPCDRAVARRVRFAARERGAFLRVHANLHRSAARRACVLGVEGGPRATRSRHHGCGLEAAHTLAAEPEGVVESPQRVGRANRLCLVEDLEQ